MIRKVLTGKQKSFLRSLGTKLEPVVNIGKEGLTPAVVTAAREAVRKRELIKVRVQQNCMETPEEAISVLAERAGTELVQIIGRNGLLYRKNAEKPKIDLP